MPGTSPFSFLILFFLFPLCLYDETHKSINIIVFTKNMCFMLLRENNWSYKASHISVWGWRGTVYFPRRISNKLLKKILFTYLFLERGGREGERERNINVWLPLTHPLPGTWPITQACALTGKQTSNPLVHRLALNPLSHTSQGSKKLFKKKNPTK